MIPRASDPPGRNGEKEEDEEEDSSEGSEEEEDEDTGARAEEEHPDWPTRNMIVSFLDSFKYLTG